ncbi:MAG: glycerol-3-phosphate 1-O-acyltransferase PlsY [Candidatus Caenarcaniphilales bacterium]|nr:glycerol-3-phosphate 1-O-acyltransferase PlsY [Candidatus Caenarcaniphilales bacterium]
MIPKIIIFISVYLLAAMPFGYWIGLLLGKDLLKEGSKSTGATNALRVLGKKPAIAVLVLDILKGYLPIFIVENYLTNFLPKESWIFLILSLLPIIAHSKSVYIGFKGGKSSATGLGVLLALNPLVAIMTIIIWISTVKLSKYSSMGSIVAIPFVPVWLYLFHEPLSVISFGIIAFIYIVPIKHRTNIARLIAGTEPKVGEVSGA